MLNPTNSNALENMLKSVNILYLEYEYKYNERWFSKIIFKRWINWLWNRLIEKGFKKKWIILYISLYFILSLLENSLYR